MGITVNLAGQDITSYVDEYSINIVDTLGQGAGVGGGSAGRASTCTFTTSLGPAATALGAGQVISSPALVREGELTIADANGKLIYGGFVGKLDDKTVKTKVLTEVSGYDYYQELDRFQVQQLYTGVTDIFMIKDLLKRYAPWVNQSLLPASSSYTFTVRNFKAVSLQKCIAQITDVTGYQFWIDAYKFAHYVTPMQSQTAPFALSDSPDFFNTFSCGVESFTVDDNAAINRVTFYGGKQPSANFTQDLSNQANGSNKLFVLGFYPRIDSNGSIQVISQNINSGNILTLGFKLGKGTQNELKSAGGTADVLLNADAHTLEFDISPVNSGANSVTAEYRYEYPMVIKISDQASFQYYGRWFDGVISDDTIFDPATASGRCRTLLTEQSRGLTTLKVHCYKAGLQSGQILPITHSIRGINNSYIIQEVDTSPLGNGNFEYTVTLGAWNWNMVDMFMNSMKAAEAANIPNTSYQDSSTTNAVDVEQGEITIGMHDVWTKTTTTAGQVFYARSAAVGDGHDAYPGLCCAHS